MNNQVPTLLLALLLALPTCGAAQSVALSFDDGFNPQRQEKAPEWNAAILDALSKAEVQAIFFVTGHRVDSPAGLALVRDWGTADHEIANHTYSHHNLGSERTALDAFIADAKKNEQLMAELPGWTQRFRFPYLKEGNTAAKRDGFRNWLATNGYQTGAVSIDASDWYYSSRYLKWRTRHPTEDPTAFRKAYLDHLWDRATYYDGLATQVLGRSAKHVLLLHTNAINAAFLPDVIEMFQARGWEIISPEEAYGDPLYEQTPSVLPAGESILWALAKEQGVDGLRYPAEDGRYEEPLLDRLGL